jgi:hypothetical protein
MKTEPSSEEWTGIKGAEDLLKRRFSDKGTGVAKVSQSDCCQRTQRVKEALGIT